MAPLRSAGAGELAGLLRSLNSGSSEPRGEGAASRGPETPSPSPSRAPLDELDGRPGERSSLRERRPPGGALRLLGLLNRLNSGSNGPGGREAGLDVCPGGRDPSEERVEPSRLQDPSAKGPDRPGEEGISSRGLSDEPSGRPGERTFGPPSGPFGGTGDRAPGSSWGLEATASEPEREGRRAEDREVFSPSSKSGPGKVEGRKAEDRKDRKDREDREARETEAEAREVEDRGLEKPRSDLGPAGSRHALLTLLRGPEGSSPRDSWGLTGLKASASPTLPESRRARETGFGRVGSRNSLLSMLRETDRPPMRKGGDTGQESGDSLGRVPDGTRTFTRPYGRSWVGAVETFDRGILVYGSSSPDREVAERLSLEAFEGLLRSGALRAREGTDGGRKYVLEDPDLGRGAHLSEARSRRGLATPSGSPRVREDSGAGALPALGYGARIRGSVEPHESLDQGPEALDPSSSGEPVPWEDSDEDSDGDSNEDSSDPGPFGPVVRRERPFEGRVAYVPFEDRVAYVAYVGLDPLPGDLGTPGRLRAPGTASSRSTTAGASAPVSETSSTWDPETSSIWDPEDPGGDRGGREPTRDLSGGDGPVTRDRTETRDFEGSRAWDFAVPVPVTGLEYPD